MGGLRSRTVSQRRSKMADRGGTRSQGLQECTQLIQWDSVQDPVGIERELSGAHRQAREGGTATGSGEGVSNNSEISRETEAQSSGTVGTLRSGKISQTNKVKNPA